MQLTRTQHAFAHQRGLQLHDKTLERGRFITVAPLREDCGEFFFVEYRVCRNGLVFSAATADDDYPAHVLEWSQLKRVIEFCATQLGKLPQPSRHQVWPVAEHSTDEYRIEVTLEGAPITQGRHYVRITETASGHSGKRMLDSAEWHALEREIALTVNEPPFGPHYAATLNTWLQRGDFRL